MNTGQETTLGMFLSLIIVNALGIDVLLFKFIGMVALVAYWKFSIWHLNKR